MYSIREKYPKIWNIKVDDSQNSHNDRLISHADINECVNSPCQNGATCINTQGGYQCKCKPGFRGNQCEQGNFVFSACILSGVLILNDGKTLNVIESTRVLLLFGCQLWPKYILI